MSQHSDQDALYLTAVESFGTGLYRIVRATEANKERQVDLLQDIHVELWRSFAQFNARCSLKTWVYRVAHNTAASHVYREKRHRAKPVSIDAMEQIPDVQDLSALAERTDALSLLHDWIRRLKPMDRQIMTLYLEELDAKSIADISGLSSSAVATRISRLKNRLAQDFKEPPHDRS